MHAVHGNIFLNISNVTSLAGNVVKALQLSTGGIHVLTETRHSRDLMVSIKNNIHSYSETHGTHTVIFGDHPREAAGVALCIGPEFDKKAERTAGGDRLQVWEEEGRVAIFEITVSVPKRHKTDSGEGKLYMFAVYGETGDRRGTNDTLLKEIEREAARFRDWPTFVAGDFNKRFSSSVTMQKWEKWSLLERKQAVRNCP